MSLPETAGAYFVDEATVGLLASVGASALGEPTYYPIGPGRLVRGLLLQRTSRVWREMGLADDVEAVFLTDDASLAPPAPTQRTTLTAGGLEYRDVTWEQVRGLDGASMRRLSLRRSAR